MGESVMTRTPLIVALLMFGNSAIAVAQTLPNAGFIAPNTPGMETGKLAPNHLSGSDKLFIRQAAIGGRAEVELGKLAQQKGNSEAVRDFGKRMVSDHSEAYDQLMHLQKDADLSIPKEPDPEHKRIRDELNKASGKDFDIAYLASQIQDHQKTVNLLLWEISFGQSAELTKYAADGHGASRDCEAAACCIDIGAASPISDDCCF
jgi:putative membrane protein